MIYHLWLWDEGENWLKSVFSRPPCGYANSERRLLSASILSTRLPSSRLLSATDLWAPDFWAPYIYRVIYRASQLFIRWTNFMSRKNWKWLPPLMTGTMCKVKGKNFLSPDFWHCLRAFPSDFDNQNQDRSGRGQFTFDDRGLKNDSSLTEEARSF